MDRRRFLALAGGILALPRPVRAWPAVAPLRRLRLVNAHTRETFDGPFRDDIGPIAVALAELSEFLRDHHSGEKTVIDVGVLDFLAGVMDAVGETRATVLSAYRTRETNAMLARTHFGVARYPTSRKRISVCGLHRAASGDAGKKPNWRKCRISTL